MDRGLPGSSAHGILQARILAWVAISFSRGSSQPRDWTQVSHIAGRLFTLWATREAQEYWSGLLFPSPGDLPNPGIEPGFPVLQVDSSFLILTSQVFGLFVIFWGSFLDMLCHPGHCHQWADSFNLLEVVLFRLLSLEHWTSQDLSFSVTLVKYGMRTQRLNPGAASKPTKVIAVCISTTIKMLWTQDWKALDLWNFRSFQTLEETALFPGHLVDDWAVGKLCWLEFRPLRKTF